MYHVVPGRRTPVVQAIDDFVAGVVRVETRTEETAAGQFVTGGSVLLQQVAQGCCVVAACCGHVL